MRKRGAVAKLLIGALAAAAFVLTVAYTWRPDSTENRYADIDPPIGQEEGVKPITQITTENDKPLSADLDKTNSSSVIISGQFLPVNWNEIQIRHWGLPSTYSASELYERLENKALNGDVTASRLLALELDRCRDAFIDQFDHSQSTRKISEEGTYKSPKGDSVEVNQGIAEAFIAQLNREYEYCSDLSIEQRGNTELWAKRSLDLGDYQGALLYKNLATTPQERHDRLNILWEKFGDRNSLYELVPLFYPSGVAELTLEGLESKSKAMGYLMAANALEIAAMLPEDEVNKPNFIASSNESLQVLGSELTVDEHLEAEILALNLIKDNPNCCARLVRPDFD